MEAKQRDLLKCETPGCRSALKSNPVKELYRLLHSLRGHLCSRGPGSTCAFSGPASFLHILALCSFSPCIFIYTAKKCTHGPPQVSIQKSCKSTCCPSWFLFINCGNSTLFLSYFSLLYTIMFGTSLVSTQLCSLPLTTLGCSMG